MQGWICGLLLRQTRWLCAEARKLLLVEVELFCSVSWLFSWLGALGVVLQQPQAKSNGHKVYPTDTWDGHLVWLKFSKHFEHLGKVPLGPYDGGSCYNGFTSGKKIYDSTDDIYARERQKKSIGHLVSSLSQERYAAASKKIFRLAILLILWNRSSISFHRLETPRWAWQYQLPNQ